MLLNRPPRMQPKPVSEGPPYAPIHEFEPVQQPNKPSSTQACYSIGVHNKTKYRAT